MVGDCLTAGDCSQRVVIQTSTKGRRLHEIPDVAILLSLRTQTYFRQREIRLLSQAKFCLANKRNLRSFTCHRQNEWFFALQLGPRNVIFLIAVIVKKMMLSLFVIGNGGDAGYQNLYARQTEGKMELKSCRGSGAAAATNGKGGKGDCF